MQKKAGIPGKGGGYIEKGDGSSGQRSTEVSHLLEERTRQGETTLNN